MYDLPKTTQCLQRFPLVVDLTSHAGVLFKSDTGNFLVDMIRRFIFFICNCIFYVLLTIVQLLFNTPTSDTVDKILYGIVQDFSSEFPGSVTTSGQLWKGIRDSTLSFISGVPVDQAGAPVTLWGAIERRYNDTIKAIYKLIGSSAVYQELVKFCHYVLDKLQQLINYLFPESKKSELGTPLQRKFCHLIKSIENYIIHTVRAMEGKEVQEKDTISFRDIMSAVLALLQHMYDNLKKRHPANMFASLLKLYLLVLLGFMIHNWKILIKFIPSVYKVAKKVYAFILHVISYVAHFTSSVIKLHFWTGAIILDNILQVSVIVQKIAMVLTNESVQFEEAVEDKIDHEIHPKTVSKDGKAAS